MSDHASLLEHLASALAPHGFDLTRAVAVSAYNRAVAPPLRLPDHGRTDALAVVIGNSRALWPRFVTALRATPGLVDRHNPLDHYTETAVTAAVSETERAVASGTGAGALRRELRFSHEAPPRRVAMQRLAHVAGLAHLTQGQMCVHPIYGPWIALRAVVVWDVDAPAEVAAPRLPPPCDCSRGCARAFDRTIAAARGLPMGADGRGVPTFADVRAEWQRWVAVRDACPVGREYRYTAEQIRYHYTGDREVLRRAVASVTPASGPPSGPIAAPEGIALAPGGIAVRSPSASTPTSEE